MIFLAKTPEDRCEFDRKPAQQLASWRTANGLLSMRLLCNGCAQVMILSDDPPFAMEPLPAWTEFVRAEDREKWGRLKRRLHKDQEAMDFDA